MVYNSILENSRLFLVNLMAISGLFRVVVKLYLTKCLNFKVKLNGHLPISGQDKPFFAKNLTAKTSQISPRPLLTIIGVSFGPGHVQEELG